MLSCPSSHRDATPLHHCHPRPPGTTHLHQPPILRAVQHARQGEAAGVGVGAHFAALLQPAPQQPAALRVRMAHGSEGFEFSRELWQQ